MVNVHCIHKLSLLFLLYSFVINLWHLAQRHKKSTKHQMVLFRKHKRGNCCRILYVLMVQGQWQVVRLSRCKCLPSLLFGSTASFITGTWSPRSPAELCPVLDEASKKKFVKLRTMNASLSLSSAITWVLTFQSRCCCTLMAVAVLTHSYN